MRWFLSRAPPGCYASKKRIARHHRRLLPPHPPRARAPAAGLVPSPARKRQNSRQYIVREGDVGELFYMIVEGTVDVLERYIDPENGWFRWDCDRRVLLPYIVVHTLLFQGRVDSVLLFIDGDMLGSWCSVVFSRPSAQPCFTFVFTRCWQFGRGLALPSSPREGIDWLSSHGVDGPAAFK